MTSHALDNPIDLLARMTSLGQSGELIAAVGSFEAHVFLSGGRVAWATSSAAPNALHNHLTSECAIDQSDLSEVIDECRRTQRSLTEILLEWGMASRDQVRAALRAQIRQALRGIADVGFARALFVQRNIEYDADLTFDLSDVCDPGQRQADGPADADHDSPASSQASDAESDSIARTQKENN